MRRHSVGRWKMSEYTLASVHYGLNANIASIFLSGKDMAHPYWEYEMDHLDFTYTSLNEQGTEETRTFDFEGDMIDLTFIHDQCLTLLCDLLQQYASAHSIAGRCTLETAWSCIARIKSNWEVCRPEDEVPNPHPVWGNISEDDVWKVIIGQSKISSTQ